MKAIVVRAVGSSDELKLETEFPKPTEVPPGTVLIQNAFAGINYIDTYQRSGLYPVPLPLIPGREGSGIIAAVGEDVTEFTVGQPVAYLGPNSYSEFSIVPIKTVLALPANLSLEQGAATLLQGMTAAYLVHASHRVEPGQFVIVPAAAGGTGAWIVRLARKAGGRVIAIVGTTEKAEIALQHGAEFVFNHRTDNLISKIMEITDGKGAEVVYDGVGKALYSTFLQCLARFGSYIYFGNASGKIDSINPFDLTPKILRFMRPSLFGYMETREEFLHCKFDDSIQFINNNY
jgi:NADPH:quinone reductase